MKLGTILSLFDTFGLDQVMVVPKGAGAIDVFAEKKVITNNI